jgi:hypothetical protein
VEAHLFTGSLPPYLILGGATREKALFRYVT